MTVRPMLFSAPMVRALMLGMKTQTRRMAKRQDIFLRNGRPFVPTGFNRDAAFTKPGYEVGDLIWVREAVTRFDKLSCDQHIWYRAGLNEHYINKYVGRPDGEWPRGQEGPGSGTAYNVSSIHMPRWASRLTLEVTGVRVQRLKDISEDDAKAEGLACITKDGGRTFKHGIPDNDGLPGTDNHGWDWSQWCIDPRNAYFTLWDKINGDSAHAANPWVVAVSFIVHKQNIDDFLAKQGAA